MKNYRLMDIFISSMLLILTIPVLLLIYIINSLIFSKAFFLQNRLGMNEEVFTLYKFRTLPENALDNIATHFQLVSAGNLFSRFLRMTGLDELPQFYNVLKGEMSIVGPRPNLLTQGELITLRRQNGIYSIKPGITGFAQIRGVDMKCPEKLCKYDKVLVENYNLFLYFGIIMKSVKLLLLVRNRTLNIL